MPAYKVLEALPTLAIRTVTRSTSMTHTLYPSTSQPQSRTGRIPRSATNSFKVQSEVLEHTLPFVSVSSARRSARRGQPAASLASPDNDNDSHYDSHTSKSPQALTTMLITHTIITQHCTSSTSLVITPAIVKTWIVLMHYNMVRIILYYDEGDDDDDKCRRHEASR